MAAVRSLADDLRARSDQELAALLRDRPDLARPAPADVTALGARATTRSSIQRALDGLDHAHLQALEAVVVASPASAEAVAGLLATTAETAGALLARLRELALVWAAPEGMRPARPVADVVGDPAGLAPAGTGAPGSGGADAGGPGSGGRAGAGATSDLDASADPRLQALLGSLTAPQRTLLDALAWGPPVGSVSADPEGPMTRAAAELVELGLVERVDATHVLLPRRVALALRQGRLHRRSAVDPPQILTDTVDPAVVDEAAGGRAAELITLVTELVEEWGQRPPRVLRGGGLAVRDHARLAGHLEISGEELSWVLETAHAAGLVGVDAGTRADAESAWAPTAVADEWLTADPGERWAALAGAWWSMSAAPSLVGSGTSATSAGRVNVLSTATSYPLARQRRHDGLSALATLPPGSVARTEGLQELLRWRHPLRSARSGDDHGVGVEVALREAEWAGVTARGALCGPGRAVVSGGGDPAALMDPLVPAAVDHVLLQADLTAIAPGRLDGPARTVMHLVSDVESRGGASVHRFTETSVRRALDLGWSADRVLSELAEVSRTPVPQPLDYLVRDVARRHGQARVGAAASYLRSDDAALLDRVERDRALSILQWRRIAPTVLVSPVPAATVLDLMREEQYGPVPDGGSGLDLTAPALRRAPRASSSPVRVSSVDDAVARQVVALMRRGEGARSAGLGQDSGHTDPVVVTATLREAAADGHAVWIGYADDAGGVSTHLVRPVAVEGGRVRASVGDGDASRSFVIHRVTRVRPAD